MSNRANVRHDAYMRGKELLQATGLSVSAVVYEVRESMKLSDEETTELTNALNRWAEVGL